MAGSPAELPPDASKAEQVYQQLRAQIEAGELAPGAPLAELALVARTGASRTPVREALRRLAADGLVDLAPRQGARVSRISLRSVRDLFEFRSLLEPVAAREAADAVRQDAERREAFQRVRAQFDVLRGRAPAPDRSGDFYELADRFDWMIIDATRNEHLRRTIGELRPHTARLRNLSHGDPQRIEVSLVEHLRMCDAILAGDGDEAAAAVADHLAASLRTIFETLTGGADPQPPARVDLG